MRSKAEDHSGARIREVEKGRWRERVSACRRVLRFTFAGLDQLAAKEEAATAETVT